MKKFSNNLIIFLSGIAFIALAGAFLLNPSEASIVKTGVGESISKINLLAAEYPIVPCGLSKNYDATAYDETKQCSICHLYILTGNLINFVIYNIAIPLAALMFLVAGVYLIFSGGSEERIKTGRTIFQNTVIALVIIFCAWVFLNTLFQYLTSSEYEWLQNVWWKPFGECK